MENNYSVVYLAFGKRDGFEVLFQSNDLEDFQTQEDLDMLYSLIQLKLEEIRIFPDSEILGAIQFKHHGNWYKVFTLYRYTLDIYKRDGYYAGAVVMKNSQVDADQLWEFLQNLSQKSFRRITHQPDNMQLPVISLDSDYASREILSEDHSAIIHLREKDAELYRQWISEMMVSKKALYRFVYITSSSKVIDFCDQRKVRIVYHPGLSPVSIRKEMPESNSDERNTDVKEDSLIFEYEDADDHRWGKKEHSRNKKSHSLTRFFRFFSPLK
ncbi:MAG: hypothetical protein KDD99_09705 [Bacteroidetes bacterium]|nr:hypothetical protein [Bacteroidota bacterium]